MRPKRIIIGLAALAVLAALVLPAGASAATVRWTGGTDTHWGTKANWDTGNLPTSSDDVIIDNTSTRNPTVDAGGADSACGPCAAKSVTLSGSKQLTIAAATLNVTNGISAPSGTNVKLPSTSTGTLTFGTLTVGSGGGLTMAGGTIAGTLAATTPTTLTNSGTTYNASAGAFSLGTNVTLDQTHDLTTSGAVNINTNGQTYILDNSSLMGGSATVNVGSGGTLRHQTQSGAGGTLEPKVAMDSGGGGTIEDASSGGGSGLLLKNPNGVTSSLAGTLRVTTPNSAISLTGPSSPATGNTYQLVGPGLTTDATAGGTIQMTGKKESLDLNGKTVNIKGFFLWDATATGTDAETILGTGGFSGPGGGATSTLIVEAGGTTGGTFQASQTVTVDAGTTVDVKTADMSWPNSFQLDVFGQVKLEDTSLRDSSTPANTPKLTLETSGDLVHTGTAVSTVEPLVTSTGTIEDNSSMNTGMLNLEKSTTITNSLGGTIKTDGANATVRLGIDTHQVGIGGLTTGNTAGGTIEIAGAGTVFDLNGNTVTIKGTLLWDATDTTPAETMMGSGTFTGPGGGAMSELRIKGGGATGGNFQASHTVTIGAGTTMDLFNGDMSWPNNFGLALNGTLLLEDRSIDTASAPSNIPVISIGTTGNLLHTGSATSNVQPEVNSTGFIEDNSSGKLNLENPTSIITNLLGGTIRTDSTFATVQLGTDVHQVVPGGLTTDTTAGGAIQTANSAELKLDDAGGGHTLTVKGTLTLPSGTVSTNKPATIAGPGNLDLAGASFALGGPLTVSAPVFQGSNTDVGGFGGELDIAGTWNSQHNITDSSNQQTLIKVVSGGVLEHTGSTPSSVLHPLVIDGLVDDTTASGAAPNWTLDSTNAGMNATNTTTVDPTGTVQADANTLKIVTLSNFSGGTLTTGNYVATGKLQIPGDITTLNANATLNGSGMLVDPSSMDALTGLSTIGSSGALTVTGGKSQTVSSPLTVNGLLGGAGTVVGNVINQGTVKPGTSPGTLNINGNYLQASGATLKEAINGAGAGQFSVLHVMDNLSLAGTVALLPSTGYAASAAPGDSQAFLTYGGTRSGTFSSTTVNPALAGGKPYTVTYDDAHTQVLAVVGQPPSTTTTGAGTTTGGAGTGTGGMAGGGTSPGSSSITGPGVSPTSPSHAFRLVDVVHHRTKGTATLVLNLPGPGTVTVTGTGIKGLTQTAEEGGNLSLTLKPTGRTRRKLHRHGTAKITLDVTFTPRGGTPLTEEITFRLLGR